VLAPPGGHKPEFDAWRWEALDRTPALIVDFKRPVYHEVVKLFAGFANLN
jgi:putative (di)nucleoside polyphosphate hydrolase